MNEPQPVVPSGGNQPAPVSSAAAEAKPPVNPLATVARPAGAPVRVAVGLAKSPARQALDELNNRAAVFSTLVTTKIEAPVTEPGVPKALVVAKQLTAAETIAQLEKSLAQLIALSKTIELVNTLGTPGDQRSVIIGSALMPLAVMNVAERMRHNQVFSESEERLARTFLAGNGQEINVPEWFSTVRPLIEIYCRMKELPGPEVYLETSKVAEPQFAPLRRNFAAAQQAHMDACNTKGSDSDLALAKSVAVEAIVKQMDELLANTKDIQPQTIEECCHRVELTALPNYQSLQALQGIQRSINFLLRAAFLPTEKAEDKAVNVDIPEIVRGEQLNTGRVRVDLSLALKEVSAPEHKIRLINLFCDAREELVRIQKSVANLGRGSNTSVSRGLNELETSLGCLVSASGSIDRDLVGSALSEKESALQPALGRLFSQKVRRVREGSSGSGAAYEMISVFDLREQVPALQRLIERQLLSPPNEAVFYDNLLSSGTFGKLTEWVKSVRTLVENKKYRELASVLDKEIDLVAKAGASAEYQRKAVLLFTLSALSEKQEIKECLKGCLTKLDQIKDIANAFSTELCKSSDSLKEYGEGLRKKIERAYSFDLSDYWGQREMVQRWHKQLEDNIKLLKNPQAWEGSSPDLVFLNGFLLFGLPGAGKTYLVKCMAVQLGLSLVNISKEDMASAPQSGKKSWETAPTGPPSAEKSVEAIVQEFANFLKTKITEAKDIMKRTNAPACFLLIDELEAEFAKRTSLQGSPRDVGVVNSMLRIIEREMRANPEIFFVGATNHIDMVDPAALRPGRYGIHMEIKLPNADEIKEFFSKALRVQGVTLPEPEKNLDKLAEAASGMTALSLNQTVTRFCALKRIDAAGGTVDKIDIEELLTCAKEMKANQADMLAIKKAMKAAAGED